MAVVVHDPAGALLPEQRRHGLADHHGGDPPHDADVRGDGLRVRRPSPVEASDGALQAGPSRQHGLDAAEAPVDGAVDVRDPVGHGLPVRREPLLEGLGAPEHDVVVPSLQVPGGPDHGRDRRAEVHLRDGAGEDLRAERALGALREAADGSGLGRDRGRVHDDDVPAPGAHEAVDDLGPEEAGAHDQDARPGRLRDVRRRLRVLASSHGGFHGSPHI